MIFQTRMKGLILKNTTHSKSFLNYEEQQKVYVFDLRMLKILKILIFLVHIIRIRTF